MSEERIEKPNGMEEARTPLKRHSAQASRKAPLQKVPSGLANPLTGAMVYGQAISRRHTAEMSLNSSVNMDMRREYEGSPDLRGDQSCPQTSAHSGIHSTVLVMALFLTPCAFNNHTVLYPVAHEVDSALSQSHASLGHPDFFVRLCQTF